MCHATANTVRVSEINLNRLPGTRTEAEAILKIGQKSRKASRRCSFKFSAGKTSA
ncbi:hypothetical protein [Coleofasciculus sp.]|uniref:hypothetical protein n=1 Tax=Coleofasciculus sp. TaxID=3100458 RepID=UPI003A406512